MVSVNKAILIGNLGHDPEIKAWPSGEKYARLSVATTETWKDKTTGEKKEKTEWHRVTLKGDGLARVAEAYLKKGSAVYIEGQIQTRKYQDQSGQDKYSTEIVVGAGGVMKMLGGRPSEAANKPAVPAPDDGVSALDDEIPF